MPSKKMPRINTHVTEQALARLNYECDMRSDGLVHVTQAQVVTELIMKNLRPVPGEVQNYGMRRAFGFQQRETENVAANRKREHWMFV